MQLDIAVLERTVGDAAINKDLWQIADESVSPELKPVLERNGFRACQTGSTPPPCLLDLLKSEQERRCSCRILTRAGNPTPILLGSNWATCDYDFDRNGVSVPVELHEAQCVLTVVPTLADDGRVTLRFAPEVARASVLKPQPQQDPSGTKNPGPWWPTSRPNRIRGSPGDLTVKPNEFAVVGTLLDQRRHARLPLLFAHRIDRAGAAVTGHPRLTGRTHSLLPDVRFDDHALSPGGCKWKAVIDSRSAANAQIASKFAHSRTTLLSP